MQDSEQVISLRYIQPLTLNGEKQSTSTLCENIDKKKNGAISLHCCTSKELVNKNVTNNFLV